MTFSSEAYVVHEPGGPITIEEIEYGDIAADEIVVETAAFSVCASDQKAAAGKFYLQPPMILGHECAGIGESETFSFPPLSVPVAFPGRRRDDWHGFEKTGAVEC